ncbi:MAG: hypothetical protein ACFFD4_34305, partial [Candidatus Odinarchaeota archaeon]
PPFASTPYLAEKTDVSTYELQEGTIEANVGLSESYSSSLPELVTQLNQEDVLQLKTSLTGDLNVTFESPLDGSLNGQLLPGFLLPIKVNVTNDTGTNVSKVDFRYDNDAWIDITGYFNDITGLYEYTINTSCLEDDKNVTFTAKAEAGGITSYDYVETTVNTNTAPFLVVDNDGGVTNYETYYIQAIESAFPDLECEYWNVSVNGYPSDTILNKYQIVIWFTGENPTALKNYGERTYIEKYVENGGKIFLSGKNIASYVRSRPDGARWLSDAFHVEWIGDDSNGFSVNSTAADPIFNGINYTLGGDDSAQNTDFLNEIDAIGVGTNSLTYNGTDSSVAAVHFSGDNKTIFFGFGLETISTTNSRKDVINRVINWFGIDEVPAVQIQSPVNNSYLNDTSINVTFTGSDDNSISYYQVFVNGISQIITGNSWALISLNESTSTIRVIAVDSISQIAVSAVTVTADITAPRIETDPLITGDVHKNGTAIAFSISDLHLDAVQYHWDEQGWAPLLEPYETALPAGEGAHAIYINASDKAGNNNLTSFIFITDDTAPEITLNSPLFPVVLPGTVANVSISDLHPATSFYRWNSSIWNVFSGEIWIPDTNGLWELEVNATDAAGNENLVSFLFSVEGSPPAIALLSLTNNTVHRSGTAVEVIVGENVTFHYNWDNGTNTTPSFTLTGAFNTQIPAGDGSHVLEIFAQRGYLSDHTKFVFTTDDLQPDISITSAKSFYGNSVTLSWIVSDVAYSHSDVYIDDRLEVSNASSPVTLDVSYGTHTAKIVAYDLGGNSKISSVQINVLRPVILNIIQPTNGSRLTTDFDLRVQVTILDPEINETDFELLINYGSDWIAMEDQGNNILSKKISIKELQTGKLTISLKFVSGTAEVTSSIIVDIDVPVFNVLEFLIGLSVLIMILAGTGSISYVLFKQIRGMYGRAIPKAFLLLGKNGVCVYSRVISEEFRTDPALISSFISAISSVGQEIFGEPEQLVAIKHQEHIIILEAREEFIVALIANKETRELRLLVKRIVERIEAQGINLMGVINRTKVNEVIEPITEEFFPRENGKNGQINGGPIIKSPIANTTDNTDSLAGDD